MATLGENIRKARIDKRMKQKDLHEGAGLSQRYLSTVEHDRVDPRFSVIRRIAAALHIPVEVLVAGVTDD